jgi:hypothetical protein
VLAGVIKVGAAGQRRRHPCHLLAGLMSMTGPPAGSGARLTVGIALVGVRAAG